MEPPRPFCRCDVHHLAERPDGRLPVDVELDHDELALVEGVHGLDGASPRGEVHDRPERPHALLHASPFFCTLRPSADFRDADGVVEARAHELPAPAPAPLLPAERPRVLDEDAGDALDRVVPQDLGEEGIAGVVVPPEVDGQGACPASTAYRLRPAPCGADTVRKSFMLETSLLEKGLPPSGVMVRTCPGLRRVVELQRGAAARVSLDDLLDLEDDRLALLPLLLRDAPRALSGSTAPSSACRPEGPRW